MNIPKLLAPHVSRWHDLLLCTPSRVQRQASRRGTPTARGETISVAIAHYNRGRLAHRPLCNLLNNPYVGEVVFFDDGSSREELAQLQTLVSDLSGSKKIHIETRMENLGAQATKLDAVMACRNEWVLVLDSDNTAFPGYLRILSGISNKNRETIYCSPFAFPYFSFAPLAGRRLDFETCARLTKDGTLRRVFIINDGNYLVHRETYVQRLEPLRSLLSGAADVMLANYLWLSKGGVLQVLHGGTYHHRVDPSSYWVRTAEKSRKRVMEMFSRFAAGLKWDNAFAESYRRRRR